MELWLNYYHPSTVAFVDDQQTFLTAIKNRLPLQTLALFFNDSKKALDKITADCRFSSQNSDCIVEVDHNLESDFQNHNEALFSLNLGSICQTLYNPK